MSAACPLAFSIFSDHVLSTTEPLVFKEIIHQYISAAAGVYLIPKAFSSQFSLHGSWPFGSSTQQPAEITSTVLLKYNVDLKDISRIFKFIVVRS